MNSFKYGWQNFKRNLWLSGAVIIILILLFFSFSSLISLNVVVKEVVDSIRTKADLSLYLNPDVTENSLNNFKAELESFEQVEEIKTINAQEAFENFKKLHQNDPEIMKSLDEINQNPFGPTLLLRMKPESDVAPILELVTSPRYEDIVQEKDFGNYQQLINKIDFAGRKIKFFGFLISGLFILIVILMIFNAIRLSIYARVEEIKMMRLVGATASYIRLPFFVEIVISLIIASIINAGLFLLIINKLQLQLSSFLGLPLNLFQYIIQHPLSFFGGQFIFTLLICWLSANAAMKKYLNL